MHWSRSSHKLGSRLNRPIGSLLSVIVQNFIFCTPEELQSSFWTPIYTLVSGEVASVANTS